MPYRCHPRLPGLRLIILFTFYLYFSVEHTIEFYMLFIFLKGLHFHILPRKCASSENPAEV